MNLIIDIGNTAAKLVAFDGNTPIDEVRTSNETLEGLPDFIRKYPFDKGAIASVYGITEQVNDSGNDVPAATMVNPTTVSLMPRLRAILQAESTNKSPPNTKPAKPNIT